LEAELEQKKKENIQLIGKESELGSEVKRLKMELEQHIVRNNQSQQMLEKIKKKNEEQKNEIKTLNKKEKQLETHLAEINNAHAKNLQKKKQEFENMIEKKKQLQKQIEEMKKKQTEREKIIKKEQQQYSEKLNHIQSTLNLKIEKLNSDLEKTKKKYFGQSRATRRSARRDEKENRSLKQQLLKEREKNLYQEEKIDLLVSEKATLAAKVVLTQMMMRNKKKNKYQNLNK